MSSGDIQELAAIFSVRGYDELVSQTPTRLTKGVAAFQALFSGSAAASVPRHFSSECLSSGEDGTVHLLTIRCRVMPPDYGSILSIRPVDE
ncbi:hypothetical protein ATE80_30840 [Streptomyces kanasensis]|uniref:Uncharacterized protein n=1 Tax=Streptomyces kanasensis TaxID=936756 RepID=A0A100XZZ7_9ACTN|nr:hypothetical protein ATE80_30840 [Streptomyces kanasensis]